MGEPAEVAGGAVDALDAPPEVEIGLPADFRDVPLEAEPGSADWDAAASHFLGLVAVERPAEHRALALSHLAAYRDLLTAGGVVKAAACLGVSAGLLTTAAVLVSWVPAFGPADADVAAMGLYRSLNVRYPDRIVHAIELPAGPAVAVIAERTLAGDDGTGPVEVPVRSVEVSIPVDGQAWVLVVALSSPSLADWDSYEAIMAAICRSVRFVPASARPE